MGRGVRKGLKGNNERNLQVRGRKLGWSVAHGVGIWGEIRGLVGLEWGELLRNEF